VRSRREVDDLSGVGWEFITKILGEEVVVEESERDERASWSSDIRGKGEMCMAMLFGDVVDEADEVCQKQRALTLG